jgi:hypothetical protein
MNVNTFTRRARMNEKKNVISRVAMMLSLILLFGLQPAISEDVLVTRVAGLKICDAKEFGFAELNARGNATASGLIIKNDSIWTLHEEQGKYLIHNKVLLNNERIMTNQNGKYLAVQGFGPEARIRYVSVQTPDGNTLWNSEVPCYVWLEALSDDGGCLVAASIDGPPEGFDRIVDFIFHDGTGKIAGKVTVDSPGISRLSSDGRRFVVATYKGEILTFSPEGEKLWALNVAWRQVGFSDDAQTAVTGNFRDLSFFRQDIHIGSVTLDRPVRDIALSTEGDYALVATNHELFYYRVGDLHLLWNFKLPEEALYINSLSLSENGHYAACGVQRDKGEGFEIKERYSEGQVCLFDAGGNLIWQEGFEYSRSNAWTPTVRLSTKSEFLAVMTRDDFNLYQISSGQ